MATKRPPTPPTVHLMKIQLTNEKGVVHNPSTARRLSFGVVYDVPRAPYWMRRLKDGSIERCTSEAAPLKSDKVDELPRMSAPTKKGK